ncbi:hypothetical protein LSAT2_018351 [Lamellibrachia satsuma]|nr:hypothetical protein LSAT2_018351 [Lamellibrachia satsuma]
MAEASRPFDLRGLLTGLGQMRPPVVYHSTGGYPEEIFVDLSKEEIERYQCSICFLVIRDPRQCCNAHLFCASCIYTWSNGGSEGSQLCPVCRVFGRYRPNANIRNRLLLKRVRCLEAGCEWKGQLKLYNGHHRNKHQRHLVVDAASRVATDGDDATTFRAQRRQVEEMMGNLGRQLERRRAGINALHRQREVARQEQMQEVHDLSHRLNTVSTNLNQLLTNMAADSKRYRRYIQTTENVMGSMPSLPQSVEPPVIGNAPHRRATETGASLTLRRRPHSATLRARPTSALWRT